MRRLIILAAALATTSPLLSQEKKENASPEAQLYQFMLTKAKEHFDARRQVVAKLKTTAEIEERQRFLKEKFIAALGGFPEKTPLNGKVMRTLKGDGFHVENVIYESRPNHHVTANFYLPQGKGPFPGVLVPCGHSANGKAAEAYQRASILMAQNGFAVLCYDPIGQGERIQNIDSDGKPVGKSSTGEHTLVGIGAWLSGTSCATYRIWDGIRSMDYLASRPEVDASRLGCTGNSGGGTLTSYLMVLDDRIKAAAPSCYICSLEKLFETRGPQDAEQNITGQVAFGMEHADYLTMRAPLPTLMCVATQDFFDIDGAWNVFREAKVVYGRMGFGERVSIFEFEDPHGFSKPRRQAAARWMSQWLQGKNDPIFEKDFVHFKDADLQCSRTGQVVPDLKGVSAFQLNVKLMEASASARAKFIEMPAEKQKQEIRHVLGISSKPRTLEFKSINAGHINSVFDFQAKNREYILIEERSGGLRELYTAFAKKKGIIDGKINKEQFLEFIKSHDNISNVSLISGNNLYEGKLQLTTERGIWFQAFFENRSKETILILGDQNPETMSQKYKDAKQSILSVNLRGMGEAKEKSKENFDLKNPMMGIHLARPLVGQRAEDILALLNSPILKDKKVSVVAHGQSCIPAIHAAGLDSRIEHLTLDGMVVSWENVVRTPVGVNQLANVVPNVMQVYDLPQLAATLAPRGLTLRNTVNAQGKKLPIEEVKAAYAECQSRFQASGGAGKLVIE